ncbi:MAG TPA: type IV secretion system protein [Dyella sp.]|nr:type IV secretion system protein [Dyella sp.]
MFGKNSHSPKIDETVAKSLNFEVTIADIARRSERRAWWVAFCAIGMTLILAGGYFFLLPLKEKVPYLIMADAYTGTSTVARLTDGFTDQKLSTSEAINRSHVAHYVMARETYDVTMMKLHDWNTVMAMSSPALQQSYRALYAGNNPESPYRVYGPEKAIRIKILSIVLLGGGPGVAPKGATVRLQRNLYDKKNGLSQPLDSKIATLAFTYKPDLKMDEQVRIDNPLGFQATDYRVDNDYTTATPAEVTDTPTQAQDDSQTPSTDNGAAQVTSDTQAAVTAEPPAMPERDSRVPQTGAQGAQRR